LYQTESTNASNGVHNVGVGFNAGQGNVNGTNNTFIGDAADATNGSSLTNATAIGSNAFVTTSNSMVLGSISGTNGATANTNVGIGTTAPGAALDIASASNGMRINGWFSSGASIGGGAYVGTNLYRNFSDNVWKYTNTHASIGGAAIQFDGGTGSENDILFVRTTTPGTANANATVTESMRIQGTTGNVGIGTATPQTQFDVVGTVASRTGLIVGVPGNGNQQLQVSPGSGYTIVQAINPSVAFNSLALNPSGGNVGIGTTAPGVPLDIATTTTAIFLSGGSTSFNSLNGGTLSNGSPTPAVSVRATGAFLSTGSSTNGGFYVTSDERIKRKVRFSDSRNDLATLMKLKITDYKYVDSLNTGNVQVKGVFAQQVETVYPQAISRQTGFIPNIYAMADRIAFDETKQTLSVTITKAHNLTIGDKVKLISSSSGEKPSVVTSVDGNTFTVSNWTEKSEKIFVFGKEVNDFRIVDYDRLFTLNISATQELMKMIEEQKKVIDDLKTKEEESKKKITLLEASLNKAASSETELKNLRSEIEKIKQALGLETTAKKE
jgi:hypothetical protein